MNIKDIKVGETHYVRVKVTAKSENRLVCRPLFLDGTMSDFAPNFFNFAEAEAFYKSMPETAPPKYDPCRLLRKGDRVQVKKRDGRCNGKDGEYLREAFCTVAEDETQNELVRVLHNATEYRLDPAYLELVTPVEELEPYYVEEGGLSVIVNSRINERVVCCSFHKNVHPNAKAAAEAERDRLNAEWRKAQNNE